MNKFTQKKDFKLLIILFAIEFVMLLICFIIAHLQVNSKDELSINKISSSMSSISTNIINTSFGGNGIEAFNTKATMANDYSTSGDICKYYTFQLSDEGIGTNVIKGESGLKVDGLTSNTATSNIIPEAKQAVFIGKVKFQNDYVHKSIDVEEILSKPFVVEPMDNSKILIYHVHGTEGYCETVEDKYDSSSSIKGDKNNVIEVGDYLQNHIQSKTGIKVLHDKTVFEEGLQSVVSYNNAAVKLDEIYAENKDIKLQIDIHRNAAQNGSVKYGPTIDVGGKRYSQISFVVGLDYDENLGEHIPSNNPYWEDNLRLCFLLASKLEEKVPGIVRLIEFRRTPYNQNYAENSLLVEIGFNGNLTSEALETSKLFGDVLSEIYG